MGRDHVKRVKLSATKLKMHLASVPLVQPQSVKNFEESWIRHSPILVVVALVVLLYPPQNANACVWNIWRPRARYQVCRQSLESVVPQQMKMYPPPNHLNKQHGAPQIHLCTTQTTPNPIHILAKW